MRRSYLLLNSVLIVSIGISLTGIWFVFQKIHTLSNELGQYNSIITSGTRVPRVLPEYHVITADTPVDVLPASSTTPTITSDRPDDNVSLPPQATLSVPFTSQAPEGNWDQPWQDACEEAAVLMFDAYYDGYGLSPLFAKDELQKMVDWEQQQGWGGSIEIEKIKKLIDEFGFGTLKQKNLHIIEDPTIDDIKRAVANGDPVLVVADGKKLPNPNFRNGGPVYHALIIRGYTETTFITNDPGTRNGEAFEYVFDDLMNAIGDWNNGNPSEGRKVVLVVE